ncbi:hypothetical protein C0993_003479 [Termitomyces sp. T159_Od127]|nr:hypothetical protein C0993_003479 [Termitomyces sp. T159_Od127]
MAFSERLPQYSYHLSKSQRTSPPPTKDMISWFIRAVEDCRYVITIRSLDLEPSQVLLELHYARVLRDLQHLHTVSITIADFGGGKFFLGDSPERNPYLWAGECDSCMEIMYEDECFRDLWVAKKKDTKMNRYLAPPTLNVVEWKFWRAEASEEVDVEESGDESTEESAGEA